MITFKFELKEQEGYYKSVKEKLKTQFYQNLHFYVLPKMPEKFRGRVVFLPEVCKPDKIYKKQRIRIENLGKEWKLTERDFLKKLKQFFPEINSVNILISPSLYGTVGSYHLKETEIVIKPRYDRKITGLQKLIITALTHYFFFSYSEKIDKTDKVWFDKQNRSAEIENGFFSQQKHKSMLKVLDTEFAGRLAEESSKYLEKLKSVSKAEIRKPDGLTKSENEIFNLLLRNKNKLVTFEEISEWLWREKIEEKYSEYAITKLIERLKKKLPKNIIHSQRGIGYLLHI